MAKAKTPALPVQVGDRWAGRGKRMGGETLTVTGLVDDRAICESSFGHSKELQVKVVQEKYKKTGGTYGPPAVGQIWRHRKNRNRYMQVTEATASLITMKDVDTGKHEALSLADVHSRYELSSSSSPVAADSSPDDVQPILHGQRWRDCDFPDRVIEIGGQLPGGGEELYEARVMSTSEIVEITASDLRCSYELLPPEIKPGQVWRELKKLDGVNHRYRIEARVDPIAGVDERDWKAMSLDEQPERTVYLSEGEIHDEMELLPEEPAASTSPAIEAVRTPAEDVADPPASTSSGEVREVTPPAKSNGGSVGTHSFVEAPLRFEPKKEARVCCPCGDAHIFDEATTWDEAVERVQRFRDRHWSCLHKNVLPMSGEPIQCGRGVA